MAVPERNGIFYQTQKIEVAENFLIALKRRLHVNVFLAVFFFSPLIFVLHDGTSSNLFLAINKDIGTLLPR